MSMSTRYHTRLELTALAKAGTSVTFYREQAERLRACAKRNDGVEFDDGRQRHKDNTAAALYDKAADLLEAGNLNEDSIIKLCQY